MSDNPHDEQVVQQQLKWPLEDGLAPLYANQFSIMRTPHEVVLVFGEFIPTGFYGRTEEDIRNYLETAEVKPISKIVMSPAGAKALLGIMLDNLKDLPID